MLLLYSVMPESQSRSRQAMDASTRRIRKAVGLGQALREWVGIHKYSLSVVVHFMLLPPGGVDAILEMERIVVFRLSVSPRHAESSATEWNPATTFSTCMTELQSDPLLRPEELADMRPDAESAARAGFCGDSANVVPTGFVYVMLLAEGTHIPSGVQCAVYRAYYRPNNAPLSDLMFAVCWDMSTLFVAFVNESIVIRTPAHHAAPPEVDQMVQARKAWRFKREERAWQSADLASSPAMSLWTHFREW